MSLKTKNEIWNSFIGKKILLINPDAESVEVAVVTGCDPDIGICLNAVGDPEPHTICLGTKAPGYEEYTDINDSDVEAVLNHWFNMIQSGYFSYPATDLFLNELLGDYEPGFPSCPYSM